MEAHLEGALWIIEQVWIARVNQSGKMFLLFLTKFQL